MPEPPIGKDYAKKVIFSYTLGHLPQSRKVVFFYALKGRYGKEGILGRCNVQQLSKGALLVPFEHAETFEAFLQKWECPYSKREALVEQATIVKRNGGTVAA